jgi:hypothetical protein
MIKYNEESDISVIRWRYSGDVKLRRNDKNHTFKVNRDSK